MRRPRRLITGRRRPLPALPGAAVLALVLAALALPAAAQATTLEHWGVPQLVRHASLVVEGTVLSTAVEQTGGQVRTAVRLRVARVFKGDPGPVATFYVPGGTLPDGTEVIVDSMAAFSPGEECCVFVDVRGWVIAGFQGKIALADGRVVGTGEKLAALVGRIKAAVDPAAAAPLADAPAAAPGAGAHGAGAPVISSVTPNAASAGTDTRVVIAGSGFGATRGTVEFTYDSSDNSRIPATSVTSWSDTSIECIVPVATIDRYPASAGSGPMWVTTAAGSTSAPFTFSVPFGYGLRKWASPQVTYWVNTSGIDSQSRQSLVDAGTAAWNGAGSAFTLTDAGTTTAGLADDGKNVISWSSSLPQGTIAQSSSSSFGGVMSEADIQFNNAYDWGDGSPGSGTMDIQSTATHETGHWLVLRDLYGSGDTEKVMYGYGDNEWVVRALTPGDIAGITWIYPKGGGGGTDLIGPVCEARSATVKRGKTVKLYFKVYDAQSTQVTSQLDITTLTGAVKKSWSWDYGENTTDWWYVKYKATLPKGIYWLVVNGEDEAGNQASKVGRATLTIK